MRFHRHELNVLIQAVGARLAADPPDPERATLIDIQVKLERMLQGASSHIRPSDPPPTAAFRVCCEGARRLDNAAGNLQGYWCPLHGLSERP